MIGILDNNNRRHTMPNPRYKEHDCPNPSGDGCDCMSDRDE
jgi:hypothetical protein